VYPVRFGRVHIAPPPRLFSRAGMERKLRVDWGDVAKISVGDPAEPDEVRAVTVRVVRGTWGRGASSAVRSDDGGGERKGLCSVDGTYVFRMFSGTTEAGLVCAAMNETLWKCSDGISEGIPRGAEGATLSRFPPQMGLGERAETPDSERFPSPLDPVKWAVAKQSSVPPKPPPPLSAETELPYDGLAGNCTYSFLETFNRTLLSCGILPGSYAIDDILDDSDEDSREGDGGGSAKECPSADKDDWDTVISATPGLYGVAPGGCGFLAIDRRRIPLCGGLDKFHDAILADCDGTRPTSVLAFMTNEGDKDVRCTPWEGDGVGAGAAHTGGASGDGAEKTETDDAVRTCVRTITYRRPLTHPLGPPSCRVTRTQTLRRYCKKGLVVENSNAMKDVPACDCFTVVDRWIVEPCPGGTGVFLSVYFEIRFTSRTMLRGIITKQTNKEGLESFRSFADFAEAAFDPSREAEKEGAATPVVLAADLVKKEPDPVGRKRIYLVLAIIVVLQIWILIRLEGISRPPPRGNAVTLSGLKETLLQLQEAVETAGRVLEGMRGDADGSGGHCDAMRR